MKAPLKKLIEAIFYYILLWYSFFSSERMYFFICLLQALYWTIESPAGGKILLIHIHFEIYPSKSCWIYFDFYNLWSKNTCIIWKYRNMLWKLLFCHHRTNFNHICMVFRVGFQLWMFSNERLPMLRAFRRVFLLFCAMHTTRVMSKNSSF